MIGERFQDALYLGGNPGFPVGTDAVPGCLALNDDNVAFEVTGEWCEVLFTIAWANVNALEVDGPNALQPSGGRGSRALLGALLAGIPGAIVGAAMSTRQYQTVVVLGVAGNSVGFLVGAASPIAVEAAIRAIPAAATIGSIAGPGEHQVSNWRYLTVPLDQLAVSGEEGWEAVAVFGEPPQVLCKRRG